MKTSSKLSAFFVGLLMLLAAFSPAFALPSLITADGMSTASINGQDFCRPLQLGRIMLN